MATTSTKDNLLIQAELLFADKGFYGTSINDVAKTLGLTKQGLLHHFPTKEKLYGAVLESAADYLYQHFETILSKASAPKDKMLALCETVDIKDERLILVVRLFVRELLDNPIRAEKAKKWVLKKHLDLVEGIIIKGQEQGDFVDLHPLSFLYHILGAQHYFLVSLPTLQQMYSVKEFKAHMKNHVTETKRIVASTLFAE